MKRLISTILVFLFTAALLDGCGRGPVSPVTVPSAALETTAAPVTTPASTPAPAPAPNPYDFPNLRTEYRLDLTDGGTAVIDRESGVTTVVPFGEKMFFKGEMKYSKDTDFIIHHVRSHAETYVSMEESAILPVDFLRTSAYWAWDNKTPRECMEERFNTPWRFPDQPAMAIVSYVNMTEFSNIDGWDAAFDPDWDLDSDAIIDDGAGPLPEYVDTKVFNAEWKNYIAKYWTEGWREVLKKRIDLAAAQHFDGIMLDVPGGAWRWKNAYPSMDMDELTRLDNELLQWISGYVKEQYGSAFLVTGNFGGARSFTDFGKYVDGAYCQNFFFSWDGSGIVNGYGLSASKKKFENIVVDFYNEQGVQMLNMEHLGTGVVSEGLDFVDYNDRITEEKLLALFRWAIDSGSTPFVIEVFMAQPYKLVPRFSRVFADMPSFSDTSYADWVLGSEADDVIPTGAGDDMVYGGPGDDQIDGGQGDDAAYYTGQRKDYEVVREGENVIVTARKGDEGKDVLKNIERLIFSDMTEEAP
ncbi:MAG: hypothetical protein BWY11_02515 [Firmicutes bacterium ADurb.Bin182]|nr:MAG: hypothetical protein BWY11_02515 [Firmicutes bacterium ADurb.Bin182]